jgi:hypothetical protein
LEWEDKTSVNWQIEQKNGVKCMTFNNLFLTISLANAVIKRWKLGSVK